MSASKRGPYWIALLPLASAALSLVRWLVQGSGNLYTAQAKRFFVPHPDLGWQAEQTTRVWLGLDAIGILGISTAGVLLAAYLIVRRERQRTRLQPVARTALMLGALTSFVIPVYAFMSGGRPPGARDELPVRIPLAQLPDGVDGGLPVPAGTYYVNAKHSSLVAKIIAGKEEFDAIFASGVEGALQGDLSKPAGAEGAAPLAGKFSVPVGAIDTGISLRSEHAREYLHAAEFPTISFTLGAITAARIEAPQSLQIRANGTLSLMGKDVPVVFTGVIKRLDEVAKARLGLANAAGKPTPAALMIEGGFTLKISQTGLAAKQSSFDRDDLPVAVTLVLQLSPN